MAHTGKSERVWRFAWLTWLAILVLIAFLAVLSGMAAASASNPADFNAFSSMAIGFGAFFLVCVAIEVYRSRRRSSRPTFVFQSRPKGEPEPELSPAQHKLLCNFGRFVRVVFFAAAAGGILLYVQTADWSATHTPFAQMTLAVLGEVISRMVVVIGATVMWVRWAFNDSEHRAYEAWGYFGLAGVCLAIVGLLKLSGN
jgi:hypothetical protein